jgi:putative transposase
MGMVGLPSEMAFDYSINEILKAKLTDENELEYTVVSVFPKSHIVALSLQCKRPVKPILVRVGEDIGGRAWEMFVRTSNTFSTSQHYLSATKSRLAIAFDRYSKLKPIIDSGDLELYIKGDLSRKSKVVYAELAGIEIATLYKYLNQYLAFGSHPLALLPLTYRCGTKRVLSANNEEADEKRAERGGSFIGAKGASDEYLRRDVTQEDIERIIKFIKKYLSVVPDHKITSLHTEYCQRFCYSSTIVYGHEERYLDFRKFISIDQFTYHFKKLVNWTRWVEIQTSAKHVQNNHDITRGKAQENSIGPSDTYEIDATTLNIYVVSRINSRGTYIESEVIGRPYLYFVVDTFSSMIVGYCITLKRGVTAVKQALFNAFTDKVEFCAKYGIQIDKEDWPCQHVCVRLLCDRAGEYTTTLYDDMLAADLQLETITFATAYLSKRKGTVEVNFDSQDKVLFQRLEGAVKPNYAKDAVHPSNYAIHDIDSLNRLIIESILSFNRQRMNHSRLQSFDLFEGVKPTPLALWNKHISKRMSGGNRKPKKLVMYAMLEQEEAKVSLNGILISSSKLVYRTLHKGFQEWQQEVGFRGKEKPSIMVRVNKNDPRYAWYLSEQFDRKIIEFTLASHDERFEELIAEELIQQKQIEKKRLSINRKDRRTGSIALQDSIAKERELSKANSSASVPDRKGIVAGIQERFNKAQQSEYVSDVIETRETFGVNTTDSSFAEQDVTPPKYKGDCDA